MLTKPARVFGLAAPLSHTQFVQEHRLDKERPLVDKAGAEAGFIDQPAEQVEVGIRDTMT
jgi:hypothetical protein